MGNLTFRGSDEERRATGEAFMIRVDADLYGGAREGFMDEVNGYIDQARGEEKQRERQHKENRDRLNLIIGLLVMIAAYLAVMVSIKGLSKLSAIPGATSLPTTYQARDNR